MQQPRRSGGSHFWQSPKEKTPWITIQEEMNSSLASFVIEYTQNGVTFFMDALTNA